MISARTDGIRLALGLMLAALATAVSPARAQTVTEVQVTPETMTLGVGQKQPVFAAAYDRRGNLIPSAKFDFQSSDTTIARVLKDGTVLGVRPGLAKVQARVQGRRASLAVLITGGEAVDTAAPPPLGVLALEPAAVTLLPGETARLAPRAIRDDGTPAEPGQVTWKSLRPDIAAVDSAGTVIAVAPGRTIVQAATSTGLMATAPVEVQQAEFTLPTERLVLAPEQTDTLRALVPSQGRRVLRSGLQWRSADTTVARVGPTGVVQGRAPGQTVVTATGFSQERHATVVVHKVPQALVVSPRQGPPVQVTVGGTRRFSAVAEAADSTPIPEVAIAWEVGDTSVAGFDPDREILTARRLGTTTLSAHLGGFDPVMWTIEVIPGVVGLGRSRLGLPVGGQATLTASLLNDDGKAIGPAPGLRWSSDRPEVATVEGGVVRAVGPGRAVVTATAPWGKAASAVVFVVGDLLVASDREGEFRLYQLRAERPDSFVQVLADSGAVLQGVYSPDRTRIAFSSDRAGSYDLYVVDADGQNLKRLTADPGIEAEPAWTPDGTRLVYAVTPPQGAPQLFTIGVDGGDNRALTTGPEGNRSPAVSPDGRTIAFISTRDGNPELYLMDTDGGDPRRITKTGERESAPRFFPNGDLVYAVDRGGRSKGRIVRLPSIGGDETTLVETKEPVAGLGLSRDGTRLAYVVGRLPDRAKGRAALSFFLRPATSDGTPVQVPLQPGERVLSPSF